MRTQLRTLISNGAGITLVFGASLICCERRKRYVQALGGGWCNRDTDGANGEGINGSKVSRDFLLLLTFNRLVTREVTQPMAMVPECLV